MIRKAYLSKNRFEITNTMFLSYIDTHLFVPITYTETRDLKKEKTQNVVLPLNSGKRKLKNVQLALPRVSKYLQ